MSLSGLTCSHADCTLPEGGRCARALEFTDPLTECPQLRRLPRHAQSQQPTAQDVGEAAPWAGAHLDHALIDALLRRSPARLIAVLGPTGVGKTCLLISFFLQIASGQRGLLPYRFASSLSLHSLRQLAAHAQDWQGLAQQEILPHTSLQESAGHFLHLGLRPEDPTDDRHIDVLLSDLPGEWLSDWTEADDEAADQRLLSLSRCDGFLVLADAHALLSPRGQRLDGEIAALIDRVAGLKQLPRLRPGLALVFTKFDRILGEVRPPTLGQELDRTAWGKLAGRIGRTFSALKAAREAGMEVDVFPMSAFPNPLNHGQPIGVMEPFRHVLAHADRRDRLPRLPLPMPRDPSSFLAMRRWEGS